MIPKAASQRNKWQIDTNTFMFDEKEEDKGVADYCKRSHEHQENETGKKYLENQWKNLLRYYLVRMFLSNPKSGSPRPKS